MEEIQEEVRIKEMISFPKNDLELLRSLAKEHGWGLGTIGNVYRRLPRAKIISTTINSNPEESKASEAKLLAAIFGKEKARGLIVKNEMDEGNSHPSDFCYTSINASES